MPSGKQYIRIITAVLEIPGTPFEVAAELGIKASVVSAQLSRAHRDGLVARRRAPDRIGPAGGQPPYVYSATG